MGFKSTKKQTRQSKRPEKLEQKNKRRNRGIDPLEIARCLQERNATYRGDAGVSSAEGQLRGAAHTETHVAVAEANGAFRNRVQHVNSIDRARRGIVDREAANDDAIDHALERGGKAVAQVVGDFKLPDTLSEGRKVLSVRVHALHDAVILRVHQVAIEVTATRQIVATARRKSDGKGCSLAGQRKERGNAKRVDVLQIGTVLSHHLEQTLAETNGKRSADADTPDEVSVPTECCKHVLGSHGSKVKSTVFPVVRVRHAPLKSMVTEETRSYDLFAQPNSYMDSPSIYDKTLSILSKPNWVNSDGVVILDIFRFLWEENGKDTNRFAIAMA